MNQLVDELERLATRGTPRGADEIYARALLAKTRSSATALSPDREPVSGDASLRLVHVDGAGLGGARRRRPAVALALLGCVAALATLAVMRRSALFTDGTPTSRSAAATGSTAATTLAPFDAFASLPLGAAACSPASPMIGNEFRGTSDTAQLSGLIFNTESSMHAGDDVKLVVRMTGSGPLTLTAIAPSGAASSLPTTAHTGSTFNRPGDEWDAEITYTEAGCWQLQKRIFQLWYLVGKTAPWEIFLLLTL